MLVERLKRNIVIAIDGPAGSGKSTTARLLAKRLGMAYIDSGAFYRAITLEFINQKVDIKNSGAVAEQIKQIEIALEANENGNVIFLNGRNVSAEIRSPEVTALVSAVAALTAVREKVTQQLHKIARNRSLVVEGRDIGTVVFPHADLKIYMEAAVEERARRRHRELHDSGVISDFESIKSDIERRDQHDSQRLLSPLSKAADAVVLNTTNMNVDEVVEFIVAKLQQNLN
jgi:cytidylate kinase